MKKLITRSLGLACLLAAASPAAKAGDPVTILDLASWQATANFNAGVQICNVPDREIQKPWTFSNYAVQCYNYNIDANNYDDYFITPEVTLQPGHLYKWIVGPSLYSSSTSRYEGIDKYVGFLFGPSQGPNESDVTIDDFEVLAELPQDEFKYYYYSSSTPNKEIPITVETAGQYRLGIHVKNDMKFWNFRLQDFGSSTAPEPVTDLAVVPDASGALKATISFTMPTKNCGGTDLGNNLTYKIYRRPSSDSGDPVLIQNDNATAGETVTWTDESAPQGDVYYYVDAYAGDEPSDRKYLSVYVGPETPKPVTSLALTHDGTTATLTWVAPTVGTHNITLDPAGITYTVTRVMGNESTEVATGLTATTFSEDINSDDITALSYKVKVVYSSLESTEVKSNDVKLGVIRLPFEDSFSNGEGSPSMNACWSNEALVGSYIWEFNSSGVSPSCSPQDNDGGLAFYKSYSSSRNNQARLYTANIDVNSITAGVLDFWVYMNVSSSYHDKVLVQYSRDGGEWTTFTDGEIDLEDGVTSNHWENFTYSLTEATEGAQSNIRIAFTALSGYGNNTMIDNVKMYNIEGNDLTVTDICITPNNGSIDSKIVAGTTPTITFTVANRGAETVNPEDYSLNIITDFPGEITMPETVAIPSLGTHTFTIDVPFLAHHIVGKEEVSFQAEVVFEADDNVDNNKSVEAKMPVAFLTYTDTPGASGLKYAIQADKSVELTWTPLKDPNYTMFSLTESFEDVEDGAHQEINGWQFFDVDQLEPNEPFTAAETSMLSVYTVDGTIPVGADGDKVLGVAYRRPGYSDAAQGDWIISPELNMLPSNKGRLTFQLGVNNAYYYDYYSYQVYYTTDELDAENPVATFAGKSYHAYDSSVRPTGNFADRKMATITVNNIPGNAKYVAIRFNATDTGKDMYMWVDNLHIEEYNDLNVLGYNVYEEGVGKLNDELVAANVGSFTVPALADETDETAGTESFRSLRDATDADADAEGEGEGEGDADADADTDNDNLSEPGHPIIPVRRFFVTAVYAQGEATPTNTVETPSAYDLDAFALYGPDMAKAGEEFQLTFTVTNDGNIDSEEATATLYNGDTEIATATVPVIEPRHSATLTFNVTLPEDAPEDNEYHAVITAPADHSDANNTSATVTVKREINNLEATISAPEKADAGVAFEIKVTVTNSGNVAASDYIVNLTRNGELLHSATNDLPVLEPGQSTEVTFTDHLTVTSENPTKYMANVGFSFNADDNNSTPEVSVELNPVTLEVPTGLTALQGDGGIVLTWDVPANELPELAGLHLTGYRVYRNDTELTTEPVTENSYTDAEELADGSYSYTVVAVYNAGESEASAPAVVELSGLSGIYSADINVVARDGHIAIYGADGQEARVFNTAGALLYRGNAETVVERAFAIGNYIVAVANRSFKVQLR